MHPPSHPLIKIGTVGQAPAAIVVVLRDGHEDGGGRSPHHHGQGHGRWGRKGGGGQGCPGMHRRAAARAMAMAASADLCGGSATAPLSSAASTKVPSPFIAESTKEAVTSSESIQIASWPAPPYIASAAVPTNAAPHAPDNGGASLPGMVAGLITAGCGQLFPTLPPDFVGRSESDSDEEEARVMELAVKESISSGIGHNLPPPILPSSGVCSVSEVAPIEATADISNAAVLNAHPPSGRWLECMAGLLSMGFVDVAANTAALQRHNGDIALVVNDLLSSK